MKRGIHTWSLRQTRSGSGGDEEHSLSDFEHQSFGGFGFWVQDSYRREFNEVWQYLKAGCEKVADRHLRESVTPYLKELISNNFPEFCEQISSRIGTAGKFAYAPVLKYIDPTWFVRTVLKRPGNLEEMRRTFESRHNHLSVQTDENTERDWVLNVLKILKVEIAKSEGIRKLRLERSIPRAWRTLEDQPEGGKKS
jgi:hypothetical protein